MVQKDGRGSTWRSIVVVVIMIVLFAASISGAYALSQARQTHGDAGRPLIRHVRILNMTFSLPPAWRQVPDNAKRWAQLRDRLGHAWVMQDPSQPTRNLVVTRLVAREPTTPAQALQNVTVRIFGEAAAAKINRRNQLPLELPGSGFSISKVLGVSPAEDGKHLILHIAAVLTADGRAFWAFYLVDQIPYEKDRNMEKFAESAIAKDDILLLSILKSVQLHEPTQPCVP